jgi:hypothetical protein
VESLRRNGSTSIKLVVDSTPLVEPCDVADAFLNHFQLVYNNPSPVVFLSLSSSSEFLFLSPIPNSDIFKALKTF